MSETTAGTRQNLRGRLPMALPEPHRCPICGAVVHLTGVVEWGADDGEIRHVEHECDTEPDIDSDEWPDWYAGHWRDMPYLYWLPWEQRMLRWLNRHYYYCDDGEGGRDV